MFGHYSYYPNGGWNRYYPMNRMNQYNHHHFHHPYWGQNYANGNSYNTYSTQNNNNDNYDGYGNYDNYGNYGNYNYNYGEYDREQDDERERVRRSVPFFRRPNYPQNENDYYQRQNQHNSYYRRNEPRKEQVEERKEEKKQERKKTNDELILDYENNIRKEIEETTPLISEELNIDKLIEEYKSNEEYSKSVENISQKYKYIRKVRRDGNCFYRSFIFRLFEHICIKNDKTLFEKIKQKIIDSKELTGRNGYEWDVVEDFYDLFLKEFTDCFNSLSYQKTIRDYLNELFKDKDKGNYLIYFIRFCIAAYLKENKESYQMYIDIPFDEWIRKEVEAIFNPIMKKIYIQMGGAEKIFFFKDEDNKVKERNEAKNGLEQYCYQVKQTVNDAKLKDKFYENERKLIEGKVDEVIKWSNDNPAAAKDEYNAKVKEVEAIFNPIKQKIYIQMCEAPGGMPNFNPGAPAECKGTATGGAEDVE